MDRRLSPGGRRGARPHLRRTAAWVLLVIGVVATHLLVTRELAARMAQFDLANAMPQRIAVAYVRTIEPEAAVLAPPAPAPRTGKRVPTRVPRRPAPAASAAAETKVAAAEASASAVEPQPAASEPPPLAAAESASAPAATERTLASADGNANPSAAAASAPASSADASAPAAAASGVPTFHWPGATRVSYVLTGNYRGEVSGTAQVEWIRIDERYQVNLDLVIGPDFAPIISRRMTSEGTIAPSGLVPERYDEDTQMVMRDRRRLSVVFESDAVVLANGERRDRLPGVQDTASQFVQLTYMFSVRPELLRVGNVVAFPLALPRAMDNYAYEIVDDQRLITPFGALAAFHLKPRPRPTHRNELTAELWIAPELRYLPVRIRIAQDAATFIDLMISRKPEIAADRPTTTVASARKTP